MASTFVTLFLAGTAAAVTLVQRNLSTRCKEVSFQVSGTAQNVVITNPNDIQGTIDSLTANLLTATVSGTQTLAGYYCEPYINNANSTKLQIFRGSFFTNRESWTALGGTPLFSPPLAPYQPQIYSWFEFVNKLGYPTLAIDSLGDGNSSRPDPVTVAQIPYEVAIYHDLVQKIRAGTTGQLPCKYSYIAHIGNSLGSVLGTNTAAAYPQDFDAIVLTGYSKAVYPSFPGVSLNAPAPASVVNATRFPKYPLGYVTSTNQTSLTNSFFGQQGIVDFDPQVAALFYQRRDTVSLGNVVATYLPTSAPVATGFKGRVLVITGENDQAFCGLGSSALSPNTMCGPLLKETGTLYPAADYNYQSVPKTGHATILHKNAKFVFTVAHNFLAGAHYGA
ncbi:hypothetical protein AMS68_002937 [Peltaster fructicola]|uniref:Uncharacterized protein n=1 Tax=Peltaster fructicola TaxID=286661 RepID=A0A6H0XSH3_9PEZI|nr:hypothetical protein AMS68_002937 [Peltaster fructicola]